MFIYGLDCITTQQAISISTRSNSLSHARKDGLPIIGKSKKQEFIIANSRQPVQKLVLRKLLLHSNNEIFRAVLLPSYYTRVSS